jgi:hypothetical protein
VPLGAGGWFGLFGQADCGQCRGLLAGGSALLTSTATRGNVMYIGIGTVILIILVILLILFLRRRV